MLVLIVLSMMFGDSLCSVNVWLIFLWLVNVLLYVISGYCVRLLSVIGLCLSSGWLVGMMVVWCYWK